MSDLDKIYNSQLQALECGVNGFACELERLHAKHKAGGFGDWPTVLLATLLQTTAVSLFKLLPPPKDTHEAVDRRSIATLIRNIVDTHDVIDLVCDSQSADEFNLHRDILSYYLAGRKHLVRSQLARAEAGETYDQISKEYWKSINAALQSKERKKRLKSGESLFYRTRKERVDKACGKDAEFVQAVLTDLSTYVHSTPPVLWFSTLEEGFDNTKQMRESLTVWVQVANFYYASSLRLICKTANIAPTEFLAKYLDHFRTLFKSEPAAQTAA